MNKFKIAVALSTALFMSLFMLFMLAGCGAQEITGKAVHQAQSSTKPIKIGWIGPLSTAEAVIGLSNTQGIEIAIDDINKQGGINGRKLILIKEDDQYSVSKSITAYKKLAHVDQVDVLFMITYDSLFPVDSLAEEDNVVVINSLDTSEELANLDAIFAVGIYDEGIGYTIADFAAEELKEKEIVVLYHNSAFPKLVKDSVEERFATHGGTIKLAEAYEPETADFKSVLLKIKNQNIDTVVVIGFDEAGFVLKQAKELGIMGNFIGIDTSTSAGFLKNARSASDDLYFTFWEMNNNERAAEVLQKVIAKYGKKPDAEIFTATGYDAMMVVAEAMKSPKPLSQALYDVKDFPGITDTLTMSDDGIVRSIREQMYQIQDGEFVKLD